MTEPVETEPGKSGIKWDSTLNIGNIVAVVSGVCLLSGFFFNTYSHLNEKFSIQNDKFTEQQTKIASIEQKIDQIVYRLGQAEQSVNALRMDQRTTDNEIKDGLRDLNKEVVNLRINGGSPNRVRP